MFKIIEELKAKLDNSGANPNQIAVAEHWFKENAEEIQQQRYEAGEPLTICGLQLNVIKDRFMPSDTFIIVGQDVLDQEQFDAIRKAKVVQ